MVYQVDQVGRRLRCRGLPHMQAPKSATMIDKVRNSLVLTVSNPVMPTSVERRNQYVAASLAALAFAVLMFLWMCVELPTYPSPTVWALTAFAIYFPVVCLISAFRSLVTDLRTAPAKTLNSVASVILSRARYSPGFRRAFLWIAPILESSLQWVYSLQCLALCSKWHPSSNPQLK